jgi:hypothetical protein
VAVIGLAWWAGTRLGKSFFGNVMSLGVRLSELQTEVSNTPLEAVKAKATAAQADQVASSPANYAGKWLALEGTVSGEPFEAPACLALNNPGAPQMNVMAYPLGNRVIVFDIVGPPAAVHQGGTLRAYGKGMVWDLSNLGGMPFLGEAIRQSMRDEPQLQGQTKLFFFLARQAEAVQPPKAAAQDKQAHASAAPDARPAP